MSKRKSPRSRNAARPDMASISTGQELRRWYWLKSELQDQARTLGLRTTGGKFQILDRISHFLDTGERIFPGDIKTNTRSKFDWHSEPLSPDTVIADSYKNTQNVRRFFKAQLGKGFKFNIEFMAWMKANTGKTLAEACTEFRAMKARESEPGYHSEIADHNQFNQYTRDFLADNPDLGMEEVRRFWALKSALPSEDGRHRYDPSDLTLE